MADRVLVPMDVSPLSERALDYVFEEHPDAAVTVLHVLDLVETGYEAADLGEGAPGAWEELHEQSREAAKRLFEEAEERAAERGRGVDTASAVGQPGRTIVKHADEHDVDLIVMGSHGRTGLQRILLGSVAETVVRRAPCPVTVVR